MASILEDALHGMIEPVSLSPISAGLITVAALALLALFLRHTEEKTH